MWTAPVQAEGRHALTHTHNVVPGPTSIPSQGFESHQSPPSPNDISNDVDIQTLWTTHWKRLCLRRSHPFQDAHYLDFAPLFASLASQGVTSARDPAYTQAFVAQAQTLAAEASNDDACEHRAVAASRLLLRACALLRVGRWRPYTTDDDDDDDSSSPRKEARDIQKRYYRRAVKLLPRGRDSPLEKVLIPHVHATRSPSLGSYGGAPSRGFDTGEKKPAAFKRPHIPLSVRLPPCTLSTGAPCPAAVILTRDRTGEARACEEVLGRGWGAVVVEIPRGEEEEEAEGRLWRSVLDWMAAVGFFDMQRIVILGEEEVALRAAQTCGERVKGVVVYLEGKNSVEFEAGVPACRVLVVGGGGDTVESNGLWTPVGEKHGDEEEQVTLSAYGAGPRPCCELTTSDQARAYNWMRDVMEGREHHFPGRVPIPTSAKRLSSEIFIRPMPEWFSREGTPPESDVDMGSACSSSL